MIKPAPPLVRAFLRAAKSYGICMPWRTIDLMPEHISNAGLIRHEQVHVAQIEREGAITWTIKIFWYLLRYGYKNSPSEVDARKIANH